MTDMRGTKKFIPDWEKLAFRKWLLPFAKDSVSFSVSRKVKNLDVVTNVVKHVYAERQGNKKGDT